MRKVFMDQGQVWILEGRKELTNGIKVGISVRRQCKEQQVGSDLRVPCIILRDLSFILLALGNHKRFFK